MSTEDASSSPAPGFAARLPLTRDVTAVALYPPFFRAPSTAPVPPPLCTIVTRLMKRGKQAIRIITNGE
ncbi:hypothetical protein GWI33_012496 [Rhynchophorus ferrugineus]|uniref:Uncharacterized protein n=1 Tax=Rhynchophorus ferrugineus TaxID=354439 RepID=A0A834I963_RHYFE|nr:hypothetical protein GWI33_012496 [Rhynchophorus ferrugineus]